MGGKELAFSVSRCLEFVCITRQRLYFIRVKKKNLLDVIAIVSLNFILI